MSELQLALVGVALLLLLALYASGKWQERRLLRRLRERLQGGVGDPLLHAAPAREPAAFGGGGHAVPGREEAAGAESRRSAGAARAGQPPRAAPAGTGRGPAEPLAGGGGPHASEARVADPAPEPGGQVMSEPLPMPSALLRPDWVEDPMLDCALEIRCARAVDGVSVIDAAAALAHTEWKLPVHFVVWDGRHQQWVLPDRFGYYADALAAIQLADRHGRVDEVELARFVEAVRQLAAKLDADVDDPDRARLLAQALELDRLCARFDIRIGLTVDSGGTPWTGPQLRGAAQQAGFVATGPQRWVRYDDRGDPLYILQADPQEAGRLTLEFDIATAPIAARGLHSMVSSAVALARALGGRVVDDNGEPVDPQSMDGVERQLVRVYEEMRQAGIEPGSTRARRLYV